MGKGVFFSYGSVDRAQVSALAAGLEAAGVQTWIDHVGIRAGEDWSAQIVSALDECSAIVLALSEASIASTYVRREIALAAESGKPIVPVYLTPVSLPPALRLHLAGIQHLDLPALGPEETLRRLLAAVSQHEGVEGPARPVRVPVKPPSGTVTFLFTDIEGSTRMWEQERDVMSASLARHDELMRSAIAASRGHVFKTIGDAFCAAFADPEEALSAALRAQQLLGEEPWPEQTPIRVRMAVHIGPAECRDNDYFGPTVNRVARLLAIGAGGQVLVSNTTHALANSHPPEEASFLDLGEHRLKDLNRAERVYQLAHPAIPRDFPPLRSLGSLPNNLPQQLSPFIGRETELREIKRLLSESRLVTLAGIGGAGKTRLALQAAGELLEETRDGVWLVELSGVNDAGVVASTLAEALSVREMPGTAVIETLVDAVRDRQLLVILDNCEHLIDECARVADRLLRSSAELRILATSRQPLGVTGETVYRLPGLRLPETRARVAPSVIHEYEALELFVERARAVQPQFALDEKSMSSLVSVCRRLDGIPLAIELAAARMRSMSLSDLNRRLTQRFKLLTGGSRTAEPRQQTLRALIDWSYDLLEPQDQLLFQRLSVFRGGWALEAAEAICAGPAEVGEGIEDWEILDLLTSLVDKSLVITESQGESLRYRMLETVREYATDKREAEGADASLLQRRTEFYVALTHEAHAGLQGPEQSLWASRLDADYDNLRAVLRHALESCDADRALMLCGLLFRYWYFRGHYREGRECCDRALEAAKDHPADVTLANALGAAGSLAYLCNDPEACDSLNLRALAIRRTLADAWGVSQSLNVLALTARNRGDYATARDLYQEQLALCREGGDQTALAVGLSNLGIIQRELGNFDEAQACLREALEIYRETGDRLRSGQLYNSLGLLADSTGDLEAALEQLEHSARIFEELGDRSQLASVQGNLAQVAYRLGDKQRAVECFEAALRSHAEMEDPRATSHLLERVAGVIRESNPAAAVELLSAADRMRDSIQMVLALPELEAHCMHLDSARIELGDEEFEKAFRAGQEMTFQQAEAACLEAIARNRGD